METLNSYSDFIQNNEIFPNSSKDVNTDLPRIEEQLNNLLSILKSNPLVSKNEVETMFSKITTLASKEAIKNEFSNVVKFIQNFTKNHENSTSDIKTILDHLQKFTAEKFSNLEKLLDNILQQENINTKIILNHIENSTQKSDEVNHERYLDIQDQITYYANKNEKALVDI